MSYFGFFADVISIFAAVTILVEIRQLKKCKCSKCNCSSNVSELSSLASESESDGSISDCSESSDDSWPLDEKLLIRSESYPCFNLTNTELGNDVKLVRAKSFNMFS